LHDALEALRPLVLAIALEPFVFHQAAAQRSRRLLSRSGDAPPKIGSQQTHCWREPDSNCRSQMEQGRLPSGRWVLPN
jgi:hypothetical protein